MPLEYQNQDSEQTLLEAIDEYHAHLQAIGRKIQTDAQGADPIWLYHDATHAISAKTLVWKGRQHSISECYLAAIFHGG